MLNQIRKYQKLPLTLAVILFISVIGLKLDVHYCQGGFAGISLSGFFDASCEMAPDMGQCCESEHEDDNYCCHDFETIVSMDYDGVSVSTTYLNVEIPSILDFTVWQPVLKPIDHQVKELRIEPPEELGLSGLARCIRHQSFLC